MSLPKKLLQKLLPNSFGQGSKAKKAVVTKNCFNEGSIFPQHITLNLVSSLKFTPVRDQNMLRNQESVALKIEEIRQVFQDKQRVILLYQYPAMQFSSAADIDPLQHLKELTRKYMRQSTLLIGVSHQHPRFLKQLQANLNQQSSVATVSEETHDSSLVTSDKHHH